jgi:1,4-dihydroxy-2-naphthoate octaprenyltransferase
VVALVIFANNLKDISFDRGSGVWTIANLLGRDRALRAFCAGLAAAYAVVAALVALRVIPVWGLAVLLSSPLAVRLASDLMKCTEVPVDADPRTARAGMVFGLLLLGAFLLQALL